MQVQKARLQRGRLAAGIILRSYPYVVVSGLLLFLVAAATLHAVEKSEKARKRAASEGIALTSHDDQNSVSDQPCTQASKCYRCRIITETKPIKKVVYDCKEVPYCPHCCPKPFKMDENGCCPICKDRPRFKRVLKKREIIIGEKCETKCVPEEVPAH